MVSTIKVAGGVAAAVAGVFVLTALGRKRRKGPAVIRLLFATAVGVGAYWQEKHRMRELAEHLQAAGYLPPNAE